MIIYSQFVWGEGVNNYEWQVWKSSNRVFYFRQLKKKQTWKSSFCAFNLFSSIYFSTQFLAFSFFQVSKLKFTLAFSLLYYKFPFQTSEQTNLLISKWLCVSCRSMQWTHLPFMTCAFQHLSISSSSQRCEIPSLKKSDVSPLSICLFFLPELVHMKVKFQGAVLRISSPWWWTHCVTLRLQLAAWGSLPQNQWGLTEKWCYVKMPGLQPVFDHVTCSKFSYLLWHLFIAIKQNLAFIWSKCEYYICCS